MIDLRHHPFAERPRRQEAYALFHRRHLDFKTPEATKDLEIQWFTFTLQPGDISSYQASTTLLDAHTDKFAGTIQLFLDGYGKFSDWAADWISGRVPAAPFVLNLNGDLTSAEDASIDFCELTGRFNNRRRWSKQYPNDNPTSGGLHWIQSRKEAR